MIKKFYSEDLKRYFDSEEECVKAEEKFREEHALEIKRREERAAKAKEVKDAYKNYLVLRDAFIKEYGSYHMTITHEELPSLDISSWFWD